MSDTHKVTNPQIELNLSQLGVLGRLTLIALITKFAPASSQYAGNAAYKAAVDKVVAHGPTLTAAQNTAEAAKKAATVAVVARDTETASADGDLNVLRAMGETLFQTDADFQNNGFNRRIRKPPVALVPPETVTATPGKNAKGAILAHAIKIAGLYKYICAISTDPTSTGTYLVQNGTAAKRMLTGLVSGQGYWIKYCTERGSVRSAWSAPVYCVAS
jgi:hypothetical protein